MKLINTENKATRIGFGEGLRDIAKQNNKIIGIGADITSSVSMNIFADKFPDRFFSFGIAEQNIVAAAAGLALGGKIPFFSTYGVFAALRATDQIRISLCYNNLHVIIGGAHSGISVGADGATHQALEDIAIMRALPNMTVISPCDANQTYNAVFAAVEQVKTPVYLRFGREPMPNFTPKNLEFVIGKGQVFKDGTDITIIATGHMVWEALQAADNLQKQNINAKVINIHTIKPIDKELIINSAKQTGAIVTAEEHQIIGGLGSAVAEVLAQNYPVPMAFVGVNDSFGESGNPNELMIKYGLKANNIVEACKKVLLS
jgi:transketolase